ncbi:DUF898 family protein [Ammonicoccus fulvus]|uniref:DUF898 family protein n=1 Tax=Ammonicoccus fulvus TaxID=3138240 RepID=A0ABZ3FVI9_9ACTN
MSEHYPQHGSAVQPFPPAPHGNVPVAQHAAGAPAITAHRAPRLAKAGHARNRTDLPFVYEGGGRVGLWIKVFLLNLLTLGFGYPWAVVMKERHKASRTFVEGRRLVFIGTGGSLIGKWIKWWFLTLITFGIYGFWVRGKLEKWTIENYDFA